MPPPVEVIVGPLSARQRAAVGELVARAAWVDGAKPLSDAALLSTSATDAHVLCWAAEPSGDERSGLSVDEQAEPSDDELAGPSGEPLDHRALVGYAHVDRASATGELVVDPAARGQGLGGQLASAATDLGARQFWAHANLPAAQALAAAAGQVPLRTLLVMVRPLATADTAEVTWPPGYHLGAYRPGLDDEGLLRVNAAAFADLPDQGGWTPEDLAERQRANWFAPADVLLLRGPSDGPTDGRATGDTDDSIVGFHWTKRHSAEVGEVYVVGLDPAHQGRGLGRPLLQAGLAHLAAAGCQEAVLFVDATNESAVRLYRRMGFAAQRGDVLYGRAGGGAGLAG